MKFKAILLFLAVFLIVATLYSFVSKPAIDDHTQNRGYNWEDYDPAYFHKYQDVQSIITEADNSFSADDRNSIAYYKFIVDIIRKRFYHGFSHYSFSDNPIASVAGNLAWHHLSAIVIPDDIMKHPKAACSQQSIVLMEIFKRNKVNYRRVGLKSHYCVEAWIDGGWNFFDANMEASISSQPTSLDVLIASNKIESIYNKPGNAILSEKQTFSEIRYGTINEAPAPNAQLFHRVCNMITSKFSFFILMIAVFFYVVGIPRLQSYDPMTETNPVLVR